MGISKFFTSITDLIKTTPFINRNPLNHWTSKAFSIEKLHFVNKAEVNGAVQLFEYLNPLNQQRTHWLWKDTLAAEVDRDWGRYMLLAHYGLNRLVYDLEAHLLAIPKNLPLPIFLSRALTLCSGIVPTHAYLKLNNNLGFPAKLPVIVYKKVIPEVVNILCSKLSQDPIHYKIEINNGEIL